ncbi:hypothetical protein OROGR_003528 [Orobanche gracilis]
MFYVPWIRGHFVVRAEELADEGDEFSEVSSFRFRDYGRGREETDVPG